MTESTKLTTKRPGDLAAGGLLAQAGQAANRAAARHVFAEYREPRPKNTLRAQDRSLALFAEYLADVAGLDVGDLAGDPQAWAGVTWGLVSGFRKWLRETGHAVGSINVRLSHVRKYTELATTAGAIPAEEYVKIRAVGGYKKGDWANIDEKREARGLATRKGDKKAQPVHVG